MFSLLALIPSPEKVKRYSTKNDGEYVDDRVNFPTPTAAGYAK
jgi:hypothetical protein